MLTMIRKRISKRIRLLRQKHAYAMSDLKLILGVHIRTVQSWHKSGMMAIDESDRPFLFMGAEVKRYLLERVNSSRHKLSNSEFYCPRCRQARKSRDADIRFKITGLRMGKMDQQIIIRGICIGCKCSLTRFETLKSIKKLFWWEKFKEDHKELYGNLELPLNTDLKEVEI